MGRALPVEMPMEPAVAVVLLLACLAAGGCARPAAAPPPAMTNLPSSPPQAGWLAGSLIGDVVVGADGRAVGRVDDLVVEETTVVAVAVTPLEEGTAPFLVSWHEVAPRPGGGMSLTAAETEVVTDTAGAWRAQELIGGLARAEGGMPYGLVSDLGLAGDRLVAVVVDPAVGGGTGYRLFAFEAGRVMPGPAMEAYRLPVGPEIVPYPVLHGYAGS